MIHVYEAHLQHYITENVCTLYDKKGEVVCTCKGLTGNPLNERDMQNDDLRCLKTKTLNEVFGEGLEYLEKYQDNKPVTIISCCLKESYSSDDRPADYVYTIIARS